MKFKGMILTSLEKWPSNFETRPRRYEKHTLEITNKTATETKNAVSERK